MPGGKDDEVFGDVDALHWISTVFFFFSTKKTTTTMTKEVTEVATQRVNDGRAQAYELLFLCVTN